MSEVAREYANALYELSEEENAQDTYLSELREILSIFREYPEYVRLLGVPNVPVTERIGMLDESFGGKCSEYVLSFMKLMIERGYAQYLCECFVAFEDIYLERHGIIRARVQSAKEIDSERLSALHRRLEEYSGKRVEMSLTIIPSLIGGIRVELDGKLLEGSIKSRLDKLRSDITNITI